jgi:membrane protease YdiL (CAAX protease family)
MPTSASLKPSTSPAPGLPAGSSDTPPQNRESAIASHPVLSYFVLTFAISWLGALAVAAPHLLRREPLPKLTGILMFPVMLLGPIISGIALTWIVAGHAGLRDLLSRVLCTRIAPRWFAPLMLPPVLVLLVLIILQKFVSPAFAPNRFLLGVAFGVPAGIFEEIGWTGFAFPRMRGASNSLRASIILGLLWSVWHLPVIDFLGVASPHGRYLLPFFAAFALAMTAMRILIGWLYTNTGSVLLAQLMHISSTGALVIFGAPHVSAGAESFWYALYGLALWLIVALIAARYGRDLHEATP